MGMTETIKIALTKKKMTHKELCEKLQWSSQNLSGKMKRDNFSEKELESIASAMGLIYHGQFIEPETNKDINPYE